MARSNSRFLMRFWTRSAESLSDKFEWSAERVNTVRVELATFTTHAAPPETLDVVKDDASDNRIVECAVAAGSDVIVSGDKHLLALGSFSGDRGDDSQRFPATKTKA
jgi:predicted nucleic acid-binding protein